MTTALVRCLVPLAGSVLLTLAAFTLAHAESPYERDQREQLEKYQRQHGLTPQQQQTQRWEQEWRQQHPNEPLPNAGVLQKMHRQEIIDNTNRDFARMRQQRQAELRREYQLSRQRQERILASQHIVWNTQQWRDWDRQYDLAQQQKAKDYLKGVAEAGEMTRAEMAREEQERIRRSGN